MIVITEDILQSIEDFKAKLQQYNEGKLDNLKPFASIMGIYKEGPRSTYMIRPRIAGGVTSLEQLRAINQIAKKHGIQVRFTTRQVIQFHAVKLEAVSAVLDDLVQCGLITRGAGGDGVRNIACSPLSGVAQDEVFDVTPYVKAVTNYMMKDPENLKLPRKYKVAFSNSEEDTANATIADIGFIAKTVNGQRGFAVYGGGGLGGNARVALKLEDFIADTDALYYGQAMKQVFAREGDRTNRHKARLRFVVQRLGEDGFIRMFQTELKELRKSGQDLKLQIEPEEVQPGAADKEFPWDDKYKNAIVPQKQTGCYAVYIHPAKAAISTENLDHLLNFLSGLDYPVSIRLTLTQGFFVRDVKAEDVKGLLEAAAGFSSIFDVENSVSCVGPTICNFGINDSQELLGSILEGFKTAEDALKAALPRILISGCPNSCGQHQKGLIGFTGKRTRTADGVIPTYGLSFDGGVGPGVARFGTAYGDIPAEKIADFLLDLARLKLTAGGGCFSEFIQSQEAEVKKLVAAYSV